MLFYAKPATCPSFAVSLITLLQKQKLSRKVSEAKINKLSTKMGAVVLFVFFILFVIICHSEISFD